MIYESSLFKLPFLRSYEAIVLFPFVFFKRGKGWVHPKIMVHEQTHLNQIARDGLFKFYVVYLRDFILNFIKYRNWKKAYLAIPYEREAYEAQRDLLS